KLKQEGVMHWAHLRKQGFDVPFTITADVQVTQEGMLRIRPAKVEICDVNGKPLMDLLHLKLEKFLDLSGAQGLRGDGNDLILDPGKALPPPRIIGRLEKVRIEGDQLVQQIGPAPG